MINGVVFVVLLFTTGHWLRLVPTSWEVFPNALSAGLQYVSFDWPTDNGWVNYNSLQQLAYFTTVFLAAPLAAITGFRMSGLWPKKAETLSKAYPIEWARAVHFPVMLYFVAFIVVHVFLVLATGTSYPYPAKYLEDQVTVAAARLARTRTALASARRVLLVGAGPVGLELAGELTSAFPHLEVTVVEQGTDILPAGDYLPELRSAVRSQLDARGVRIVLDSRLGYLPPVDVGTFAPFTVQTTNGLDIDADIWFRCYGSHPMTDYLDADLARGRHDDGTLSVTSAMSVVGHERVFAIGDITDVRETKRASSARACGPTALSSMSRELA